MSGEELSLTPEKFDEICEEISTSSKALRTILKDKKVSFSFFYKQLRENEEYEKQYARAREAQADILAEEILSISDDGTNDTTVDDEGNEKIDHDHIARSRLRVDSRKWLAGKLKPKKYGDKTTVSGDEESPLKHVISWAAAPSE